MMLAFARTVVAALVEAQRPFVEKCRRHQARGRYAPGQPLRMQV